jgi:hypothetical protein
VDAREGSVEGAVELPEVAEPQAPKKAAERRRIGQSLATEELLGGVGAHERDVVEILAAGDERLAEAADRLRRTAPRSEWSRPRRWIEPIAQFPFLRAPHRTPSAR